MRTFGRHADGHEKCLPQRDGAGEACFCLFAAAEDLMSPNQPRRRNRMIQPPEAAVLTTFSRSRKPNPVIHFRHHWQRVDVLTAGKPGILAACAAVESECLIPAESGGIEVP